eukprot:Lankesteria_metandrocarpae@DN4854_c0_g1_i5.p1
MESTILLMSSFVGIAANASGIIGIPFSTLIFTQCLSAIRTLPPGNIIFGSSSGIQRKPCRLLINPDIGNKLLLAFGTASASSTVPIGVFTDVIIAFTVPLAVSTLISVFPLFASPLDLTITAFVPESKINFLPQSRVLHFVRLAVMPINLLISSSTEVSSVIASNLDLKNAFPFKCLCIIVGCFILDTNERKKVYPWLGCKEYQTLLYSKIYDITTAHLADRSTKIANAQAQRAAIAAQQLKHQQTTVDLKLEQTNKQMMTETRSKSGSQDETDSHGSTAEAMIKVFQQMLCQQSVMMDKILKEKIIEKEILQQIIKEKPADKQRETINWRRLGSLKKLEKANIVEFAEWKEEFCHWGRTYLPTKLKEDVAAAMKTAEKAAKTCLGMGAKNR